MDGVVGRGTLLAGRYRMFQPLASDLAGATAWAGNDQILDRPVRIAILAEGNVPQALDAARRAALVTDPRLVRVLDVGEDAGVSYLVTEPVTGPSLAQLVARGPMPANQARAIIGEAAAALEAARRRGVHHLALRPAVLHLTSGNHVLITGLAVDGALLGRGLGDARSTTRADTVALVALLYAALTGRWPGASFDAEPIDGPTVPRLPVAPMVGGVPVAPTELVAGIPNDLDTLCAVTLGSHDDGPHSPAELVLELEPWGVIEAGDLLSATTRTTAGGSPEQPGLDAEAPEPPEPAPTGPPTVRRTSVRSVFTGHPVVAAGRPGTPPPATPARTSAFGTPSAGEAPPAPSAAPSGTPGAPAAPAATAGAAALPQATGTQAARPKASKPRPPQQSAPPARPLPTPPPTRQTPATRQAPPTRQAPSTPSTPPAAAPARASAFDELVGARQNIVTKRFDPTRLVLAIVIVGLLVGVFSAYRSLTRPTTPTDPGAASTLPTAAATATAGATPAPTEAAPAEPPPDAAAAVPAIASGQMIDPPPDGDNNEHPEAAALAYDGDPATVWFTRTYKAPDYAGLKKGIGYGINLAAPATVTTVTLQVNGTGGMVEVRSTDPSTPTQGDVLAQGPVSANTVLTLSTPVQTQHLVLWFTSLPQTADGSNRIELAEVGVS